MLGIPGIPISLLEVGIGPDEIEQRIIRAYLQLACTSETDGSHTVSAVRFGTLEARLTEFWEEQGPPSLLWVWLELYSQARHAVIDSSGCTEFDESELAWAVELIASARRQAQGLH
jgi:hypothetical protein